MHEFTVNVSCHCVIRREPSNVPQAHRFAHVCSHTFKRDAPTYVHACMRGDLHARITPASSPLDLATLLQITIRRIMHHIADLAFSHKRWCKVALLTTVANQFICVSERSLARLHCAHHHSSVITARVNVTPFLQVQPFRPSDPRCDAALHHSWPILTSQ
jgi:hypothetical protein